MRRLKRLFNWELTIWLGCAGVLGWLLLKLLFPQYYFLAYPSIPVFYYVLGLVAVVTLEHSKKTSDISLINRYMLMRVIKMACTVIFVMCSLFFMKEKRTYFVLTVVLFYFIYLIMETYMFFRYEKRHRDKEDI